MDKKVVKKSKIFFVGLIAMGVILFIAFTLFKTIKENGGILDTNDNSKEIQTLDIVEDIKKPQEENNSEEDGDEAEDYKGDEDSYEPKVEPSSVQKSTYVKEVTTKTTYIDTDRDGIFDNEDNQPTINDFFIVKDENNNGIVDRYED